MSNIPKKEVAVRSWDLDNLSSIHSYKNTVYSNIEAEVCEVLRIPWEKTRDCDFEKDIILRLKVYTILRSFLQMAKLAPKATKAVLNVKKKIKITIAKNFLVIAL